MPEDINGLDVTDAGLKAIMGNRFHDQTESFVAERKERKTANTTKAEKVAEKAKEKPVEAQWEPVKEITWMDKLKACAIWAVGFSSLSCLVFYWQQAGLMASSIAVPTMCVFTALAGWGVGKNAR